MTRNSNQSNFMHKAKKKGTRQAGGRVGVCGGVIWPFRLDVTSGGPEPSAKLDQAFKVFAQLSFENLQ